MPDLEKILVFGASGFIGAEIVNKLAAWPTWQVQGFSSQEADLLDRNQIRSVLSSADQNTSVIICAAISRTVEDSFLALEKNVHMIQNLVESIPARGLRSIIFLSSTDVYGLPAAQLPIDENTLPKPDTYYGLAKFISERLLFMRGANAFPVACFRLPGVYGPTDRFKSIIGRFILSVFEKKPIILSSPGTFRDYVAVRDVYKWVEYALKTPYNGLLNIATGASKSMGEILSIIGNIIGHSPIIKTGLKSDRDHDLIFDTTKLKELDPNLSFTSIEEGIKNYYLNTLWFHRSCHSK